MAVHLKLEMDVKTAKVLQSMKEHVGAKDLGEMIRWALSIYGFLLKLEDREGAVLVQEEGELKQMEMKQK